MSETSDGDTVDAGEFEVATDTKYTVRYRRPADNEFGWDIELVVQAWYEGWKVDMDTFWGDGKTLADRVETREEAIEFAERKAREEYSDYEL